MNYEYFMRELDSEYNVPSTQPKVLAFYERKLSIKKVVTWELLMDFCSQNKVRVEDADKISKEVEKWFTSLRMKIISYNLDILKSFQKNEDEAIQLHEWWGYFEGKIPASKEAQ
jgi:hypothetical protein